ncbi:MAG: hypothetical protein HYY40_08580 [Bacteroidetes bacterium]|nr:hypothetical protein [Bacteroidota bacterium]
MSIIVILLFLIFPLFSCELTAQTYRSNMLRIYGDVSSIYWSDNSGNKTNLYGTGIAYDRGIIGSGLSYGGKLGYVVNGGFNINNLLYIQPTIRYFFKKPMEGFYSGLGISGGFGNLNVKNKMQTFLSVQAGAGYLFIVDVKYRVGFYLMPGWCRIQREGVIIDGINVMGGVTAGYKFIDTR